MTKREARDRILLLEDACAEAWDALGLDREWIHDTERFEQADPESISALVDDLTTALNELAACAGIPFLAMSGDGAAEADRLRAALTTPVQATVVRDSHWAEDAWDVLLHLDGIASEQQAGELLAALVQFGAQVPGEEERG